MTTGRLSRIFCKFLFSRSAEELGLVELIGEEDGWAGEGWWDEERLVGQDKVSSSVERGIPTLIHTWSLQEINVITNSTHVIMDK